MYVALVALVASAVIVGLMLPALRSRLLDVPNQRSSHTAPVPRGGGLGMIAAMVISAVVTGRYHLFGVPKWTYLALALLAITGLVDDLRTLRAGPRLLVQVIASLLVALPLSAREPASLVSLAASSFFFVGLVNAFNFMDGINGISAVTIAVAGTWFVWLGWDSGLRVTPQVGLLMLGAAAGFLLWNATGKVFLGDVGSYFFGGLIAVLVIVNTDSGTSPLPFIAPVVLYVGDTATTLLRRISQGHRMGSAHRDHIYQRMTDSALSPLIVASVVGALESLMCVVWWLLQDAPVIVMSSWAAIFAAYAALPRLARRLKGATA